MNILKTTTYKEIIEGISFFSDSLVKIIGEQTVKLEDGKIIEQYLYNIHGVQPENNKPFISLKENIQLL